MSAVDVAEERRVDVVAEQFLEPLGELPDNAARDGQAGVLLRPQPGYDVLQDQAEARPAGEVGAAAVPEAAEVEHGRARCHDGRTDRILGGWRASGLPAVAAGDEPGGA